MPPLRAAGASGVPLPGAMTARSLAGGIREVRPAPRVRICVVIRVRNRASRWRGSIAVDRLIRSADNQHMRSQRVRFYEAKVDPFS